MKDFKSIDEEHAMELMGLQYVKIPRYTLKLIKKPATRQLGQLHLLLFDICFFADGYAELNGRKVACKRGEYVGTQQELADLSGISIGSINRLIRKLEALHLISVFKIQGGSLIKVHGYTTLTAASAVKGSPLPEKTKENPEEELSLFEQARQFYGQPPEDIN